MAHLPRWCDKVWSPGNFYSFSQWWKFYATPEERDETRNLYIMDHYPHPKNSMELVSIKRPMPTTLKAPGTERNLQIRTKYCGKDACRLCAAGLPKWAFGWRDVRWTPSGCIDAGRDGKTSKQIEDLMKNTSWPIGPRRLPAEEVHVQRWAIAGSTTDVYVQSGQTRQNPGET